MKLWLVSRDDRVGYDEYDAMIVAAESAEDARLMRPNEREKWGDKYSTWAETPELVTVKLIGEAAPEISGYVLGSFNAG